MARPVNPTIEVYVQENRRLRAENAHLQERIAYLEALWVAAGRYTADLREALGDIYASPEDVLRVQEVARVALSRPENERG